MGEDDFIRTEQLREVMAGEADAPLRQIEAELMPHRPAQPGIDARRRRPDAFDQAADNDSIRLHQPRFQRAVDLQPRARSVAPPHRAIAERGLEHVGIVGQRHHQSAGRAAAQEIVEGAREREALAFLESQRNALLVARQFDQDLAMPMRELGEVVRLRGRQAFDRGQCLSQRIDQRLDAIEIFRLETRTRLGVMECGNLLAPQLCKLVAKTVELAQQAGGARGRARAAQHRKLQAFDRRLPCARQPAEPAQRMFQHRQQRRRLQSLGRRLRREARKHAGGGLHQHVAAGIIEGEIPSGERRHHPPCQRAVGGDEGSRLVQVPRLSHRDRNRECFHLGIGRLDHREIFHAGGNPCSDERLLQPVVPDLRRGGGPHRFGCQQIATAVRRRLQKFDIAALDAKALQQRVQGILRMVRRRMLRELAERIAHAADGPPGVLVEIGVETRQHHRAVRQ